MDRYKLYHEVLDNCTNIAKNRGMPGLEQSLAPGGWLRLIIFAITEVLAKYIKE